MNLYSNLAAIKDSLGITATTHDTRLLAILESASRVIDKYCDRHFYVKSETKYFDGRTPLPIKDLLSIDTDGLTTDSDGDATFENTFATTDYILYPLNIFPKTLIELSADSDYGNFGYSKKGCSIAGLWGYGDGISATPYTNSGDEVEDTGGISDTATSITVTDADNFSPGQTILIESEQCYISAFNTTTNILTVTRAVNGTTGATHAKDTDIYIYDYPADIEQVCLSLAEKIFVTRGKGFKSERLGDYSYTKEDGSISEPEMTLLSKFRRLKV